MTRLASTTDERRGFAAQSRDAIAAWQLARLNALLDEILPHNRFYAEKLAGVARPLKSLDEVTQLPFTTKEELLPPDEKDFAANLTWPLERYVRYHRTSGTRGRPLVVLDTRDDWEWWLETWQYVLDSADVTPADRVLMAFSFGPFIGFWSAHDACIARGAMVIPSGGLNTIARLDLLRSSQATVVFTTPSYALHMAEVARQQSFALADLAIERIIVAGEPGGGVPAVRERIETAWQARVIDHAGASEIGPWGYGDRQARGLRVIESSFLAEFLPVDNDPTTHELVLTTLGRAGCPVIRYRTGDLVRPVWDVGDGNQFVLLSGGVLGRADDMLVIRGVNIFPSSIEQILAGFADVDEWRLIAHKVGAMDSLSIEVEDRQSAPGRIAHELQLRLGLKVDVTVVPAGSLPRFEGKGKRFVDRR